MPKYVIKVFEDMDGELRPVSVFPVTSAEAVMGLGEALDGYKQSFIDPVLNNTLPKTGGIMNGGIDMNGYRIINLSNPILPVEPVTKAYLDQRLDELMNGMSAEELVFQTINNYAVEYGLIGDTLEWEWISIPTILHRIGNIVIWNAYGNASGTSALGVLPYGFRPQAPIAFFSGQSQGSNQKNITIIPQGNITCNLQLQGELSFTATWVCTEEYRII